MLLILFSFPFFSSFVSVVSFTWFFSLHLMIFGLSINSFASHFLRNKKKKKSELFGKSWLSFGPWFSVVGQCDDKLFIGWSFSNRPFFLTHRLFLSKRLWILIIMSDTIAFFLFLSSSSTSYFFFFLYTFYIKVIVFCFVSLFGF